MTFMEEEEAMAARFFELIAAVTDYMRQSINPKFDALINPNRRETYIHGLYSRAVAWMMTLKRLDQAVDFQAVMSAVRSLMEITVDLILIHHDKTDTSAFRMRQWEVSAKMKAAKALVEYFTNRAKLPIPDEYQPQVDFIDREEANVELMRKGLWPYTGSDPKRQSKGTHPDRWTGNSLSTDVIKADSLHGPEIKKIFGSNLEEFYETEYRRLNWSVHGSGLAGVWNLPPEVFHSMCGLAFIWCARMAMICSLIVLSEFRAVGMAEHLPELSEEALRICALLTPLD
jgi:hypothetical protein